MIDREFNTDIDVLLSLVTSLPELFVAQTRVLVFAKQLQAFFYLIWFHVVLFDEKQEASKRDNLFGLPRLICDQNTFLFF